MPYADPRIRRCTVLVAVMNNRADFARAQEEGWYRIPQRRAPRRIGAEYLAFYQTGAFQADDEAHHVAFYAPVRRYHLLTRGELLPSQPDHPRAHEYYFRIDVGPLTRLARPVPARRMRRITFIHTTMGHLLAAEDVKELFYHEDPFERFWQALRVARLRPLSNRIVAGEVMDVTLQARGGYLGIRCREDRRTAEARSRVLAERWETLELEPDMLAGDLNGCLRRVARALLTLGGSDLGNGTR